MPHGPLNRLTLEPLEIQIAGIVSRIGPLARSRIEWKIRWPQPSAFRQDYGPLKDMLELTDIARPGIFHQLGSGLTVQAVDRLLIFPAIMCQKMLGQKQDIVSPLT